MSQELNIEDTEIRDNEATDMGGGINWGGDITLTNNRVWQLAPSAAASTTTESTKPSPSTRYHQLKITITTADSSVVA